MGKRGVKPTDPYDRLMARVMFEPMSGCWLFTGGLNNGYAMLSVPPRGTNDYGHRVSYEHNVGPIPDGLHLDHLCRNRACVNPLHLEPVTPLINNQRGMAPGAIARRTQKCGKGHPLAPGHPNTYEAFGRRYCRACRDVRNAEWRAARKAAA